MLTVYEGVECREHWALRASVGCVLQLLRGRGGLGQAAGLQGGHGGAGGVAGAHMLFVACSAVLEPDLRYFQDRTRLTERFKQLMEAGWTKQLDLCVHPDVSLLHHVFVSVLWTHTDLDDSPTEARLLRQLLQGLSIRVVVLSELSLHHLHVNRQR